MPRSPNLVLSKPKKTFYDLGCFKSNLSEECFGRDYTGFTEGTTCRNGVFPDEMSDIASKGVIALSTISPKFRLVNMDCNQSVRVKYKWGHYPDIVDNIVSHVFRMGIVSTRELDAKQSYLGTFTADYFIAVVHDVAKVESAYIHGLDCKSHNFLGSQKVILKDANSYPYDSFMKLYEMFFYATPPSYIPTGLTDVRWSSDGDLAIRYCVSVDRDPIGDLGFAIPFKSNVIAFSFCPSHEERFSLIFSKPPAIGPGKLSKMEEIWDSICSFFGASDKTYSSLPRRVTFDCVEGLPQVFLKLDKIVYAYKMNYLLMTHSKEYLKAGERFLSKLNEYDSSHLEKIQLCEAEKGDQRFCRAMESGCPLTIMASLGCKIPDMPSCQLLDSESEEPCHAMAVYAHP